MKRYFLFLALFALLCSCSEPKPKLHIYTWADFFNLELVEQFEKAHHCQVIIDTFDSNESMYTKLRFGGTGYDLIVPSNYFLEILARQKMLQPIDYARLSNFKYFDPKMFLLLDKETLDYGLPYMFTFSGLAWRKDKIEKFDTTWNAFADTKYKGRMTMLNDPREALGAALRFLGFSVNTKDLKELEAAKQQLISWKHNLAKFESEQYKNGIASGEYLVVQGYNGDVLQVIEENENVEFAMPKEGAGISIDFLVIPQGAQNIELAHEFINFLYDPDNAAKNMDFTCFLCPNVAAYEKVNPWLKKYITPFLSEEALKKCELIKDIGADWAVYNKAWEEVKAAK